MFPLPTLSTLGPETLWQPNVTRPGRGGQWKGGLVGVPCAVRSGFVPAPFGIHLGSVRVNVGPKFWDPKILKFQKFSNYAAVASAAAAAAQIENFCEKVEGRLNLGVGLRFPDT